MILRLGYSRGREGLVVFASYLLGMAFIWLNAFACFNINDDGVLSHLAERALNGEVPHIDFEDSYTGALTYLHALSFKIGGESLESRRYCLIFFSTLFIAYFMYYLRRCGCSLYLTLSAQWLFILAGLLHFPESVPSWYLTFLGVFALTRIIKANQADIQMKDMILAGLASGLCLLFKINAVYYILVISWVMTLRIDSKRQRYSSSPFDFFILATSTIVLFIILFKEVLNLTYMLYFVLPILLTISSLVRKIEFKADSVLLSKRYMIFLFFAILPIATLILIYYSMSGLDCLYQGIYLAPMKRKWAMSIPPPAATFSLLVSIIFTLGLTYYEKLNSKIISVILILALIPVVVFNSEIINPWSIYNILAFIPLCSSVYFAFRIKSSVNLHYQLWIIPLVFSLLFQFPFFQAGYVAYTLVFSIIFVYLVFQGVNNASLRARFNTVTNFSLTLFLLIVLVKFYIQRQVHAQLEQLPIYSNQERFPKSGSEHLIKFKSIINFIDSLGLSDHEALAFPDSPEIYFYSKLKNPTRFVHEILSSDKDIYSNYLKLVKERNLPLVIINKHPEFSYPLSELEIQSFRDLYGKEKDFDRYLVLWNLKRDSELD